MDSRRVREVTGRARERSALANGDDGFRTTELQACNDRGLALKDPGAKGAAGLTKGTGHRTAVLGDGR